MNIQFFKEMKIKELVWLIILISDLKIVGNSSWPIGVIITGNLFIKVPH